MWAYPCITTAKRRRGGDGNGDGGQPAPSEPLAEWATPAADTFLLGLGAPQECLRVANVSDEAAKRPLPGFEDVYVGRMTAYGNPFPMGDRGHDEGLRDRVCDAFQALIEAPPNTRAVDVARSCRLQVAARFKRAETREWERAMNGLAEQLRTGKRLRLLCHCLPRRCHAQSIVQWLMRRIGTGVLGGSGGGGGSQGGGGGASDCSGGSGGGGGGAVLLEALATATAADTCGGNSSGGGGGGGATLPGVAVVEANDGGSSNGDDEDVAMPDTPDAAPTTPGGSGNTKKKRRRSPCSRRSGKNDRMTGDQRAMHNRRDADGDDGGASSGHVGLGQ